MSGKALLVGINAYPGAPLQGCVNDIANTANLLMQNYGFTSDQICILTDAQATTANILMKLNWLVDVKPGDKVFFHYSGHGAQVPTGDPTEPDGLSECICPVDFDWSPGRMIIDKQFVQIFSRIPAGCVFNWLSDSCHSGDLDREMVRPAMETSGFFFSPLVKFLKKLCFWRKTPPAPVARMMPIPPHMMLAIGKAQSKGHATRGMVNGLLDVGFISGCKSTQTSADAFINGAPCGAATYYFVKNIKSHPSNISIIELVTAMNQDLQAAGYQQQPQAEGARASRPLLLP